MTHCIYEPSSNEVFEILAYKPQEYTNKLIDRAKVRGSGVIIFCFEEDYDKEIEIRKKCAIEMIKLLAKLNALEVNINENT